MARRGIDLWKINFAITFEHRPTECLIEAEFDSLHSSVGRSECLYGIVIPELTS
ncbi:MAG: hypothetical protein ACR2G0_03800 [Chthoniobacterales bacterium]